MTQFDFSKFFDVEAAKFGPEGVYPFATIFDYAALLEIGRKNFQALNEAQNLALSSYHSLARRQSELLSELVEENSDIGQVLFAEGTPQEKFVRQIDVAKSLYEHAVRHGRAVSEIVRKSGSDAADILNHRVSASLTEFKGAMNMKKSAKARAAAPAKKARENA